MYAFPLCFNLIYNDQYKLSTYFQATKDCVAKTLKRLEEKIHGRVSFFIYSFPVPLPFVIKFGDIQLQKLQQVYVSSEFYIRASNLKLYNFHMQVLNHLLYLMRVAEKAVQRRVALALAHLCSPDDQRTIFINNCGTFLALLVRKVIEGIRLQKFKKGNLFYSY